MLTYTVGCVSFLRVLLVTDYGCLAGGAEVIVHSLREALTQRGHDVKVFSSSAGNADAQILADEVCLGTTSGWRTLLQCANPLAALRLRSVLHAFRPHVVHVSLYLTQLSPLILRELQEVPTVYYAQWFRAICPMGTRLLPDGQNCQHKPGNACYQRRCLPLRDHVPLMLQRHIDHHLAPKALDQVIAISHAVAAELNLYGPPYLKDPLVLHPGTVVVVPRRGMENEPSIISAGRLVREKGVDVLIHAFSRLSEKHPSAVLRIIGDGPVRASLEELTARLDVSARVLFLGHCSYAETLQWIRNAWCVCVPSLWREPFGMIALEAQMHGVPVVASEIGGLAEILVDDQTGYYAKPGDIDSLALKLDLLIGNPARSVAMGSVAHQSARKRFSLERFAVDCEAVFERLLAGGR